MSHRYSITLALIVCLAGVSPIIADDVAVNGSFENPDIATNTIDSPVVPGWTNVAFVMDSHGGWAGILPNEGSVGAQYANFGNSTSVITSQDIAVGPQSGIVSITWDATTGGASIQVPYVARLRDLGTNNIVVSAAYTAFGLTNYNTWDAEALPITPFDFGPGNYRLEIFANQTSGAALLADNVVIDVTPPVVPEPASLILLLGGSLLAVKRRRS